MASPGVLLRMAGRRGLQLLGATSIGSEAATDVCGGVASFSLHRRRGSLVGMGDLAYRRRSRTLLCVAALAVLASPARALAQPTEPEVKAEFVERFIRFV